MSAPQEAEQIIDGVREIRGRLYHLFRDCRYVSVRGTNGKQYNLTDTEKEAVVAALRMVLATLPTSKDAHA